MRQSYITVLVAIAGLSLMLHQSLSAQEEKVANKGFYSELAGPGVIMSANYDARFNSNERLGLGYRIGVGFGIGEFEDVSHQQGYVTRTYYSIPAGLNYVFGKPNSAHIFEVGAGLSILTRKVSLYYYDSEKKGNMIGFLSFMYRIMPPKGGFLFRVGLTPIIGTGGDMFPMVAIGFGYAF